ncbi:MULTISPECIES: flagellar biosynthesis regulator FlaF [Rhodopseudomonas]|uniref:Flagellar biosynthesis regulatory protein FlaF n=1 Tax=Rhodopseudomonas palustris TaxID=1076 RepID=A0A0D7F6M0_RHOPL|nr:MULTISPECIES: flagellar biosynthesis regulator FlaF [Rhodopseudomonas]KIZ47362.1 flagellar biosynthesis regulatory protein FlaF [Rhodopseudomonas palustris]MDF3811807.1 flagellar biosynthesis regulator FlaF [Rhodopseudomonas sp. BAL398]WOK20276.1 flagellar biosynthesis regulator FlaF [Rhodopseudomonas sp. BAL398]
MSSAASQAYARTAQRIASPRDIEAQALLKAARQLQDVMTNWDQTDAGLTEALMFNRKLWSIFVSDAMRDENPEQISIRQNIANIGIFVMTQSSALLLKPEVERLQALIDINRNIAAGLNGRAT